ncbi:MAG: DUF3108 domain-containing protein [Armatimonadetes bacterium]|nr:DUF3108 domain-containing protein [Akkermansiaceae bacterium]
MRFLIPTFFTTLGALAAPAWEGELSSLKVGPHPAISASSLDFQLSWKGMLNAGKLNLEFAPPTSKKTGSFVIKSTASSQGPASALFPYKHNYWSEIHPATLRSRYFHSSENDSREITVTRNRYSLAKVTSQEITTDSKTKLTAAQLRSFSHGRAQDIFSAILYIRSQKLNPGDEHTLLLFPFKSPYLLKVRTEAKEKHFGRDSIRLSFSMRKIDRDTLDLVPYKKLKKPVTLWLSDDADRIPLELRASVYIGDVRAILTRFTKNP